MDGTTFRKVLAGFVLALVPVMGPSAAGPAPGPEVPRAVDRALAELRVPGSAGLAKARSAAGQVEPDSIESYLRSLTLYPDGSLRTRQYLRDETTDEALTFIEERLGVFLNAPGDSVWRQPFQVSWREGGQTFSKEIYNGIGLHRWTGGGGAYILCGHYDTIAKRTVGWDWKIDPAPGADDNGTGIACILECARVLGGMSFDFDLRFVVFTGEEYGLLGSRHYVEEAVANGDSILGVLNIDMVGYDPEDRKSTVLMGNDRSEWIVDWLVEMTDSLGLDLEPAKVEMAGHMVFRSDHGPFMVEGYPAVSCWENIEGDSSEFNPYYHTVADTAGHISISLTSTIASMFAGTLALLADPAPVADFEVPENGVIVRPSWISVGDSVEVLAAVRNLGAATGGPVAFTASLMEGP